jgi:serine/threonine protein kinase
MKSDALLGPGDLVEDRYRIRRQIGSGGMGAVYSAEDTRFECEVALKITAAAGPVYEITKQRFMREARLGNLLGRAPGLVRVLDYGELEGGWLFLVMDLVVGATSLDLEAGSVEERLDRLEEAAELVAQVHRAGIVHRDLKPDNFMRDNEGQLWLADFGLAKRVGESAGADPSAGGLTMTGMGMGTPYFMPPEQFEDAASASLPADVYALGTMLFFALAKELPFRGKSASQILKQQITIQMGSKPAPRPSDHQPSVSADLEAVCIRAMDMEPERRHPDATHFLASLRSVRGGAPLEALEFRPDPPPPSRAARKPQPKPRGQPRSEMPTQTETETRSETRAQTRSGPRSRGAKPPARPSLAKHPGRHSSGSHGTLAASGSQSGIRGSGLKPPRERKTGVAALSFVMACALIGGGVYAHRQGYIKFFGPTPQALADEAEALHRSGDAARAAPIYKRAARAGHVHAMLALGDLYAAGDGVDLDPKRAIRWWRKAAAKGSATAKLRLDNVGAD